MPKLSTPDGHFIALPAHRVSLGMAPACDIVIAPGRAVAEVHCYLQPWESGFFLEDAASGLGTLVNGIPITWAPLKHGDVITAGNLTLRYEEEGGAPAGAFPPPAPDRTPPPAWLPPEALLPPVSPAAQPVNWAAANTAGPNRTRRWAVTAGVVIAGLAAAFAVWWWKSRHG